jgi:formate hydrogenlyase subunit 3/multisubunit Na+/H+ antiporter MnhD subunit
VTTPGGFWLVLAIMVPFAGMLAGLAAGGRNTRRVALLTLVAGAGVAAGAAAGLVGSGEALAYSLGGWQAPLGITLRADSLAVAMLLAVAVVVAAIAVYACGSFGDPAGVDEARAPFSFWLLLLAVWGSLNLVFVSGDLFTLYVALELLTFAAVPLVCLDGRGETLQAALRYLLFALAGSLLYLLGAVLLYGAYGTLDIALLAGRVRPEAASWAVLALMTAGLLAKTALFPLHVWLPPAHAGAPAAASALLSGLVIKGSWFLVVRLWFDVMPGVITMPAAQLLGALGAGAILFGNFVALRQVRLKLLVAYSTVAQIGYLFLMFPLAFNPATQRLGGGTALAGGLLQAISHAGAKSAMFMAAGLIYTTLGHDRISGFQGLARALPLSVFAFGLGGISLVGLPPAGGFLAKWWLLSAAAGTGQWWWAAVLLAGGLLTSAYLFVVLSRALQTPPQPLRREAPVARYQELAALGLALASVLLGLVAVPDVDLLGIGRAAAPAPGE